MFVSELVQTSIKRLVAALSLLTLMSASALATPKASDESRARVTLHVVHATSADGGVAPELEGVSKWLLKSFPNYKSFKRLTGREDTLAVGQEVKETLPNGTTLSYKHLGWKDGSATLALSVGGLETTVNVRDGKGFLQAGRAFEGGMIVLAFKVGGG